MPADLTAPQLIALLREHPGACLAIKLHFDRIDDVDQIRIEGWSNPVVCSNSSGQVTDVGRQYVTGAAVERCDELDIDLPVKWGDGWAVANDVEIDPESAICHPSFLHAVIVTLEIYAKESK